MTIKQYNFFVEIRKFFDAIFLFRLLEIGLTSLQSYVQNGGEGALLPLSASNLSLKLEVCY